jgi:formamidopyrimidine-DNA glycosylase
MVAMPELPEVETVRRGVAPLLVGQTVQRIELRRVDLRWPIPENKVRRLQGRTCRQVTRRSKYLQLHFSGLGNPVALIHLGMSGRLFADVLPPDEPRPPWRQHEHWRMDFGRFLMRYVDARRFGMLDVVPGRDLHNHWLIKDLGPEPLDEGFTAELLFQLTRNKRVNCKNLLMNSHNVVGVGNIYASEACFRAGVRPRRAAGRLTRRNCENLVDAVQGVLKDAIGAGGTTIRDYIGVDESTGYFQRSLMVYGRQGDPCRACGTPIKRVVETGRSTYYCPRCQI